MNLDELTYKQMKEISLIFAGSQNAKSFDNGMVGEFVIVRCKDAGVHAGFLVSHDGRQCVLKDSRRLWYWKPISGKFLSGVANNGLHKDSKIGEPIDIHLTENCEIIKCSEKAKQSIINMESR